MPSAVSDQGPSDLRRACSGSSDSRISLSMDLRASSWLARAVLLCASLSCFRGVFDGLEADRGESMHSGARCARRAPEWNCCGLALRLAASQFLDLLLVRAAGRGPLGLGSCLLAGGALHFFPFCLVFNLGGVCHGFLFRCYRIWPVFPVDMPSYVNSPPCAIQGIPAGSPPASLFFPLAGPSRPITAAKPNHAKPTRFTCGATAHRPANRDSRRANTWRASVDDLTGQGVWSHPERK